MVAEVSLYPRSPSVVELNTRYRREQINSIGRASQLHNTSLCRKVLRPQRKLAEAKLVQDIHNACAVLPRRSHEEVDITRQVVSAGGDDSQPVVDGSAGIPPPLAAIKSGDRSWFA